MKAKHILHRRGMDIRPQELIEKSIEIYNWLVTYKAEDESGIYYKVNPGGAADYSDKPVHGKYGLYSGSSGTGFFLLRLYETTGDEKYLDEAESIAESLIANTAGSEFYLHKLETAEKSDLPITGWHTGVYSGPAGAGVFVMSLYRHVKDPKYLDFARKLGDDICSVSNKDLDGRHLTNDLDLFSDGGFVLYFISLYKAVGDSKYLDIAREFARYIQRKGIKHSSGGTYYEANDIGRVGMPKGSIYPGFSHGSAGIGFLFAVLYDADRQKWELEEAESIALFLESVADVCGTGRLIPYIWSEYGDTEYSGRYYIGFCHGPAGTALLYRKLYEITGNTHYMDFCKELAQGIIETGAPELNSWGLWNSYCSCCGVPGLIEFFAEMYEFTGMDLYLEYAKRSAARVIADSTEEKEKGKRCFYGFWDRTNPRDVQTYTGLYTGASGAGANILKLFAVLNKTGVTDFWEYSYLE
ncbi:MAG: hypothetical protein IJ198_11575 [Lachnospiraceae bacterium]|nr:hypothetical protein [Lachnospiraceae bacterium]